VEGSALWGSCSEQEALIGCMGVVPSLLRCRLAFETHQGLRCRILRAPSADFLRLLMTIGVGLLLGLIYMGQVLFLRV